MGKREQNKINKGTPKAEFPSFDIYLENPDERGWGYVRIPVEEVIGKPPRLCSIIGPQKTWETDIQTLTEQLNIKHKGPIDFKDKGKCWAFYFDEDAGTLYNGPKDAKPILELRPAPKQEYVYAKTEESSKPASTENSQMSNSSVSSENKEQEKPIHNSTSVIKEGKRKESILSKKKGNERAPKELPTVNKKTEFVSHSNTSIIKGQNEDKDDITPKIEKALDEQHVVSPGELFRSGKEYENKGEFDKAIQAYRAAAEMGFGAAGYKLGKLLMKLATDIFRQIAGLGHAGAQRELEKLVKSNTDSPPWENDGEKTTSLHNQSPNGKIKDVKLPPNSGRKQRNRKMAADLNLSNRTTNIDESAEPLLEQNAYQTILNLIARYQLAKIRSTSASAQQNLDDENLLKRASKESAECPCALPLTLDDTACESSDAVPMSCREDGTPTNPTPDNSFDAVVDAPQVIIQEIVRYVTYWWGNDCLPELILIDGQKAVTCEFSLQTGHEFCTEAIIWQADFADEPSWRHIFTLIFRKLFSIFRK